MFEVYLVLSKKVLHWFPPMQLLYNQGLQFDLIRAGRTDKSQANDDDD